MSEAVVFYQLFILLSVVGVGIVVGQKSMVWVAIGWAIWTLVMVFTRWLFILQLFTIGVALFAGFALLESKRYPQVQAFVRKGLLGLGILAVIGIAVGSYFENTARRDSADPLDNSTAVNPPLEKSPSRLETTIDQRIAEPTPPQKPEPGKIYVCKKKRGGEVHVTYQDFPCISTR